MARQTTARLTLAEWLILPAVLIFAAVVAGMMIVELERNKARIGAN